MFWESEGLASSPNKSLTGCVTLDQSLPSLGLCFLICEMQNWFHLLRDLDNPQLWQEVTSDGDQEALCSLEVGLVTRQI